MKHRGAVTKDKPSQLRIIGGEWRGRKLSFHARPGLRPTSDRVRETLFNWLAPTIVGADCLDLFSGSGALGLEALSRGASYCDFVESDQLAAASIQGNLRLLGDNSARGRVTTTDALKFMDAGHGAGMSCLLIRRSTQASALGHSNTSHPMTALIMTVGFILKRDDRHQRPCLTRSTPCTEKTAGDVLYRLLTPKAQQ